MKSMSAHGSSWSRRLRAFVAGNRLFVALFAAGFVLRALTFAAYNAGIMFFGDSWQYLLAAQKNQPRLNWPYGYSFVLRLLSWTHWFRVVPLLQHAGGLALAVIIYRFLLGRGTTTRVAALAAAPVLLDGYQIAIEQYVMSETMFELLLIGGILLLMRRPPTVFTTAVGASLLAAAMLTRAIALPVALLGLGYLVARRAPARSLAASAAVLAFAYVGYGAWFHHYHGEFGVEQSASHFLYGRVAPFADCKGLHLPAEERALCARMPHGSPTTYTWGGRSPYYNLARRVGIVRADRIAGRFDRAVIEHQPLTYARVVTVDTLHFLSPVRQTAGWDYPVHAWLLPDRTVEHRLEVAVGNLSFSGDYRPPGIIRPLAIGLRSYQSVVYSYGPLLGLALLLMAVAIARRRPLRAAESATEGASPSGRAEITLLLLVSLVLLVAPNATVLFDYRYLLPAVPVMAIGAALAWARLSGSSAASKEVLEVPAAPPIARRAILAAGVSTTLVVLVLTAPLHSSRFFTAYIYAGASAGPFGAPVGRPSAIPGLPGGQLQRLQHGLIADGANGTPIAVPQGIAQQLTPQLWAAFGLPRRCSPPSDTTDEWCDFENGRLTWQDASG